MYFVIVFKVPPIYDILQGPPFCVVLKNQGVPQKTNKKVVQFSLSSCRQKKTMT